jgi:hypothetical protein
MIALRYYAMCLKTDLGLGQYELIWYKPGGLDSQDHSRSRSRFLDLSRSTF